MARGRSASPTCCRVTEKALQEAIVKFARQRGWRVYHTYDSRRSAPGFPDLVLVRRRKLIFAELKSEKGKITDEQERWRSALNEAEQTYFVWRPNDLERVFEILA
jgi:hypothetical protein